VSLALFAALVACFFLPFVRVSLEREATATGFGLATGTATFSGRYTHASYEGEVEDAVNRGRRPAAIGFAAALAGLALSWVRGRRASLWALGMAAVAGVSVFIIRPAVASFIGPEADFRYGLTLALFLSATAVVWSAGRVGREHRQRADAPVPFWDRMPK
jgi:hypothetical protein